MPQLLEDIKVLDLSRFISGPYCAMLLADMGADVVKVEKAGQGDDSRLLPPFKDEESLYFFVMNRNKRSLSLDFRSEEGQKILFDLASRTDVLIENFRPGTIEKMGCGYEELKKINPRLIMLSISGFGKDGPYKDKPGFDAAVQAMSGLMSLTGQPDAPPTMSGTFVVDYSTAMYGAVSVLAALHKRDVTGEGEYIDLTLLDSATSILLSSMQRELVLGQKATRVGNRDRQVAPGNVFRTRDGVWLMLIAGSDIHFSRLVEVMEMPHLLEDERFNDVKIRLGHADEIEAVVQEWFDGRDAADILAMMEKAGIVCSRVEDVSDVVKNPQLHFRKKIINVPHKKLGDIPMMEMPMRFKNSPYVLRRAAPMLGEHNEEILRDWLGVSPEDFARTKDRNVF